MTEDRAVSQDLLEGGISRLGSANSPVIVFGVSRKHREIEVGIIARDQGPGFRSQTGCGEISGEGEKTGEG